MKLYIVMVMYDTEKETYELDGIYEDELMAWKASPGQLESYIAVWEKVGNKYLPIRTM